MTELMTRIGFMQGRLSPIVDGKIQAFPRDTWREEFSIASSLGISLMEWTLDQEFLYVNPVMTRMGHMEIRDLSRKYDMKVHSITGDCFMQSPFWKACETKRVELERDFIAIANNCSEIGIRVIVVPLVDNGRLENIEQESRLVNFLSGHTSFLAERNLQIAFESDFEPNSLVRFLNKLDPFIFGINYDIGNSAALGFNPVEEFKAYGERVFNVHVKDRVLSGNTVPLGMGNADFESVFYELFKVNYQGNFILQTARDCNGDHSGVIASYSQKTLNWLKEYGN